MKALVIAPHPDDEVLGCGGTIARLAAEGHEVHLCIVTEAYEPEWSRDFILNRPKEVRRAAKIIGVKDLYFLGFPTVKIDTIPQKDLNAKLQAIFDAVKPDWFFIPHAGDCMKDHRLIHEACLVISRPHRHRCRQILAYETLSETEWGLSNVPFQPNYYVDISGFIDLKLQAFAVYESENIPAPHPRNVETLTALARKRGSEVNVMHAEAFMLVRSIY